MQQRLQMDRRGESAWLPRTAAIILLLSAASGPARAAEDATPAWQAQVLQQIVESEYHVTRQETKTRGSENPWQAPNRAHGFRTYFSGEGVRFEPRTEEGSSWRLGLSPSRIGREGALLEIGPAESIDVVEARVELPRDGFVEWYVNGPGGLEQGFDVAGPPPGPSSRGPLLIEIAVTGSLLPRFSPDGQAVDLFSARDGMVLRYAKLVVIDAAGSRLDARMESFARPGTGGIRLVIDDGTAVYPIVVDPLTTGAAWSDEGNQIDAEFGFSVATAGDVNGDGYSDVDRRRPHVRQRPEQRGARVRLSRFIVRFESRPPTGISTVTTPTPSSVSRSRPRGMSTAMGIPTSSSAARSVMWGGYSRDAPTCFTARAAVSRRPRPGSATATRAGWNTVRASPPRETSTATATATRSSAPRFATSVGRTTAGPTSTTGRPADSARANAGHLRRGLLRVQVRSLRLGRRRSERGRLRRSRHRRSRRGRHLHRRGGVSASISAPRRDRSSSRFRGRPTRPTHDSAHRSRRPGTSTATATPT